LKIPANLAGAALAFVGFAARASNQVLAMAVTLIAARFLAPTSFGVFAIASALVTLLRTLLYAGPYEYLIRAKDEAQHKWECLGLGLLLATGLGGLFAALAPLSAVVFSGPEVGRLLIVMAPSNLISALAAWQESRLLRRRKVNTYYAALFAAELISAVVAVVLLFLKAGLGALVAQVYARAVVLAAIYTVLLGFPLLTPLSLGAAKRVFSWSLPRYGAVTTGFLGQYGADFILGSLLSPAASGLYRASSRIVTAISDMFVNPAQMLAMTHFSARASRDQPSDELWPRVFTAFAFIGWPALAGLAALSKFLVPLILGPRWAEAAPIVAIICVTRANGFLTSVIDPLLVAYDRRRPVLVIQVLATVATLLGVVLASPHGVVAAAISTACITWGSSVPLLIYTFRIFPSSRAGALRAIPAVLLPVVLTAGAAIGSARLVTGTVHDPVVLAAAGVLAGAAAWLLASLAFRTRIGSALRSLTPGPIASA
jgi:O-antigen/teichoic acid export membrane protein